MRKILNIGGNDVVFECNAVTPILYKAEFHKDYMADMMKLGSAMEVLKDIKKASKWDFDDMDFDVFSRLAWACAKTADKDNTKGYLDWLWDNTEFSIMEHGADIAELAAKNWETKKK